MKKLLILLVLLWATNGYAQLNVHDGYTLKLTIDRTELTDDTVAAYKLPVAMGNAVTTWEVKVRGEVGDCDSVALQYRFGFGTTVIGNTDSVNVYTSSDGFFMDWRNVKIVDGDATADFTTSIPIDSGDVFPCDIDYDGLVREFVFFRATHQDSVTPTDSLVIEITPIIQ